MSEIDEILDYPFSLKPRPKSVPADFRPIWRMALIIIMVGEYSRGKRSSLKKLSLLNWAVLSPRTRERFRKYLESGANSTLSPAFVREPSFERAISLCLGEKILERTKNGGVSLTLLGEQLLARFDKGILSEERAYLNTLRGHLSERDMDSLLSLGSHL